MSPGASSASRSACVIWPIFSAVDMRDSRSSTRVSTGSELSRYGSPCAAITISPGVSEPPSVTFSRLAADAPEGLSSVTGNVLVVPDAVPAANVSVPDAAV